MSLDWGTPTVELRSLKWTHRRAWQARFPGTASLYLPYPQQHRKARQRIITPRTDRGVLDQGIESQVSRKLTGQQHALETKLDSSMFLEKLRNHICIARGSFRPYVQTALNSKHYLPLKKYWLCIHPM
jgi:hypothetical protein